MLDPTQGFEDALMVDAAETPSQLDSLSEGLLTVGPARVGTGDRSQLSFALDTLLRAIHAARGAGRPAHSPCCTLGLTFSPFTTMPTLASDGLDVLTACANLQGCLPAFPSMGKLPWAATTLTAYGPEALIDQHKAYHVGPRVLTCADPGSEARLFVFDARGTDEFRLSDADCEFDTFDMFPPHKRLTPRGFWLSLSQSFVFLHDDPPFVLAKRRAGETILEWSTLEQGKVMTHVQSLHLESIGFTVPFPAWYAEYDICRQTLPDHWTT